MATEGLDVVSTGQYLQSPPDSFRPRHYVAMVSSCTRLISAILIKAGTGSTSCS